MEGVFFTNMGVREGIEAVFEKNKVIDKLGDLETRILNAHKDEVKFINKLGDFLGLIKTQSLFV